MPRAASRQPTAQFSQADHFMNSPFGRVNLEENRLSMIMEMRSKKTGPSHHIYPIEVLPQRL